MPSYKVKFEPSGRVVEVNPADYPLSKHGEPGSILDIALANQVAIAHACGGAGVCGRCRIEVVQGAENLVDADEAEVDTLQEIPGVTLASRLSCKAVVRGDVTVIVGAAKK